LNTKDFSYFYGREFVVFCSFLILLTFSTIAFEEQVFGQDNLINPIFVLNISFFEMLGMVLPIFTVIFFSMYIFVTRNYVSNLPQLKWIFVLFIMVFLIATIPLPAIEDDNNSGSVNSTVLPTTQIDTSPNNSGPQQPNNQPEYQPIAFLSKTLEVFMLDFKYIFLLGIFFLTVTFLVVLRRQSKFQDLQSKKTKEDQASIIKTEQEIKEILECYYEVSKNLEGRGANDSPSYTPPEFTDDVVSKRLCKNSFIDNITDLFEEAKFSNHKMTEESVKKARKLAQQIITSPETISKRQRNNIDEDEDE